MTVSGVKRADLSLNPLGPFSNGPLAIARGLFYAYLQGVIRDLIDDQEIVKSFSIFTEKQLFKPRIPRK